jgi:hypothetical protein
MNSTKTKAVNVLEVMSIHSLFMILYPGYEEKGQFPWGYGQGL